MTGNFGHLGEIATLRPFRELRNGFMGEILPTRDVDCFEPPLLSPPPCRAGRHADLLCPFAQAQNCPTTWRPADCVLKCAHIFVINRLLLYLRVVDRLAISSLFGAHVSHAEEAKI
jgi:hypothetical protein